MSAQRIKVQNEGMELTPKTKQWLDSIDPLDDYGFQVKPMMPWLKESPQDELARLEMNQVIYKEFMKNKSTFPPEIHTARQSEFIRIRELKWRE